MTDKETDKRAAIITQFYYQSYNQSWIYSSIESEDTDNKLGYLWRAARCEWTGSLFLNVFSVKGEDCRPHRPSVIHHTHTHAYTKENKPTSMEQWRGLSLWNKYFANIYLSALYHCINELEMRWKSGRGRSLGRLYLQKRSLDKTKIDERNRTIESECMNTF